MIHISIPLAPELVHFYSKVAASAGKPLEQVLSDVLYKLAGELSLQALKQ